MTIHPDVSGAAISHATYIKRLAMGVLLVNIFIYSMLGLSLQQSYRQYQVRAETTTNNLSQMLSEQISDDIERLDLALLNTAEEIEQKIAAGGLNKQALNAYLMRQQARLPEVMSLRMADAQGMVKYGGGVTSASQINVADREYFSQQRDNPKAGLVIVKPLFTRISKKWALPISRRINKPDGSFAGVVYINISFEHFIGTFAALNIGQHGSVVLRDGELGLITRYPEGDLIGSKAVTRELSSLVQAGHNAGSFIATYPFDHIKRTISFRKTPDYPLYIIVGMATVDYLAEWRTDATKMAALGLFFTLVTLLLSVLIYRAGKRQLAAIEALRNSTVQLQLSAKVFESSGECIIIADSNEHILSVNKTFTKVTGYSAEEVIGKTPRMLSSGRQNASFYGEMWYALKNSGHWQGEIWNRRKNGEIYPEWLSISAVKDTETLVTYYVGVFSDITERKAAEEQIQFLAYHDALTTLPNRLLAKDHFKMAASFSDRSNFNIAVVFLDLDNFKTVNDTLGHVIGDTLLKEVAMRLRECVRDTDTLSRQGGDEFLVLLSDIRDSEAITNVVEKILKRLAAPFLIEGQYLSTSVSIGIAVYPDDGMDFDTLLKKADTAMYQAKDAGRNAYRYYTEQMNVDAFENLRMRNGLQQALDRSEFVLHYQPQIDLVSGAVIGAEALIRWNHPEFGLVSPGRFIPVAEDSGLIVQIGDWVLLEACRQAVAWREAGLPELVIAVNISAVQFKRHNLENSVVQALVDSGLEPAFLELELTESILLQDAEQVLGAVQRLKALGIKLSIDDFGTGYSSLSYLKRFNVDKLKIDQSFIRNMADDPNDAAIVRAIIQMARSLSLKTIAEGVEDERLLALLRLQHCDEVQGFYFARPMPSNEFVQYVMSQTS